MEDIYNYYYLYNIYTLINDYHINWYFINLHDSLITSTLEIFENNFSETKNHINKYLIEYKNNTIGLAEEIVKNGMFFPFFGFSFEENYKIVLGNHRFYSLLKYQKEEKKKIDRHFLFLCIPYDDEKNIFDSSLFLYKFLSEEKKEIIKVKPKNYSEIIPIMDIFGGQISNLLFEKRKNIYPNIILNNKEKFEEFINQPFNLKLKELKEYDE